MVDESREEQGMFEEYIDVSDEKVIYVDKARIGLGVHKTGDESKAVMLMVELTSKETTLYFTMDVFSGRLLAKNLASLYGGEISNNVDTFAKNLLEVAKIV